MAEERGATIMGGTEAAIKAIHDELAAFRLDTHGRLSRLESGFEQMDKRQSNVEATINDLRRESRQSFNWMVGMWLTTILAIISMSLTILSRLK